MGRERLRRRSREAGECEKYRILMYILYCTYLQSSGSRRLIIYDILRSHGPLLCTCKYRQVAAWGCRINSTSI